MADPAKVISKFSPGGPVAFALEQACKEFRFLVLKHAAHGTSRDYINETDVRNAARVILNNIPLTP